MKKVVLPALFAGLMGVAMGAQARDMAQGTIEVGGDFDLSFSSLSRKSSGSNDTDVDVLDLRFDAVYYVVPNIGLGLLWTYESGTATRAGSSVDFSENAIGPLLVFNMSLNEQTSARLFANIAKYSGETSSTGITYTSDGTAWTAGGGISYFLNDNVSLNTNLRYLSISIEEEDGTTHDTTGFDVGLGISVYLR